jgi:hypothetical protein
MENKKLEIAKRLDESIALAVEAETLQGFEKAYKIATATEQLKLALTPEYMKPIMSLQGTSIGFKTDKDGKGGYPMETVKNCVIDAVLYGLEVVGNQFNIISGQMYPTKSGFFYKLKNYSGLHYEVIHDLPIVNQARTGAAVKSKIIWTLNNKKEERDIQFPIKIDAYSSVDAILGKADRKARAWLYNYLTGSEMPDGDAEEVGCEILQNKTEHLKQISDNKSSSIVEDLEKKDELINSQKENQDKKEIKEDKPKRRGRPKKDESIENKAIDEKKQEVDANTNEEKKDAPAQPELSTDNKLTISPLQENGEREFSEVNDLYFTLTEDLGISEEKFSNIKVEVLEFDQFTTLEDICFKGTEEQISKLIEKAK